MTKLIRIMLVTALAFGGLAGARAATAQDAGAESDTTIEQGGSSQSGDAVAGQVVGIVSSGDASVDARNTSEDVDAESGDADGTNLVTSVTAWTTATAGASGDAGAGHSIEVAQTADASTGDAVGGQVIGVVTSAGGSADVVAENTSREVDVETGDADADNEVDRIKSTVMASATGNGDADAETELVADQAATASTGDGVGGQVIGVVSAGDSSVDARNLSEDVDVETGDADATNDVGALHTSNQATSSGNANTSSEISEEVTQAADASTGDGVGGQVIGVVTSAGGSADIVADNTSREVDVETGDADATNDISTVHVEVTSEVGNPGGNASAEADGEITFDQAATASSGDAVGGQVLGVVSAGDTSLDARNLSEEVDVESGDADATNEIGTIQVTINATATGSGDSEADGTLDLTQTADASSGDAVAGQVAGVVTSAGGSADAVLDSTTRDSGAGSGDSDFNNELPFIGVDVWSSGQE